MADEHRFEDAGVYLRGPLPRDTGPLPLTLRESLGPATPEPTDNNYGIQKVTIRRVTNGFIVRVGCQTFVSAAWEYVAARLGEYYEDPVRTTHIMVAVPERLAIEKADRFRHELVKQEVAEKASRQSPGSGL